MTCCSAIASSCSPRPRGRAGLLRVAGSGCTARRTTTGSARSIVMAWRCSARVSAGARRCLANQLPKMVERILSFSIAHPGLGPKRVSSELVGIHCFYVGRLRGTDGAIWQLTAIDIASSYAWAELVICKHGNPTALQASKLAHRVASELKAAGWRLERVLSDNGNEFRGPAFTAALEKLHAKHTRTPAGRPQTNGNVEALHKTILHRMLATSVRPLHLSPLHRPTPRTRHLPQLLQPRPRPPRPTHPSTNPGRHHLRCPQDEHPMSHTRRHISESAHLRVPRNL